MAAPNLTPGESGIGADYTAADWERAIRHGIAKDGRRLIIMPSEAYANLDDADAAALIAYLQTLPRWRSRSRRERSGFSAVCHGADLRGGEPAGGGGPPPGPSLVAFVSSNSADAFRTTMRTGRNPSGRELNAEFMPWPSFGKMTDDELEAIRIYIQSMSTK